MQRLTKYGLLIIAIRKNMHVDSFEESELLDAMVSVDAHLDDDDWQIHSSHSTRVMNEE